jgi:alpha-beta hydrolase superfamily lysophospholipase/SAM-dependent methyltransferase
MMTILRQAEERRFRTADGVELFYRYWPALAAGKPARAIVLFHRGHEHSGRLQHVVDGLDLPDFAMFAWDARGHGLSPGDRGFSPSFSTSVRDVETFVRFLSAEHGIAVEDMAVVAQSVGAVLAAAWSHDYAPAIRCQVLAAPAFKVKLYVPLARPGLKLLQSVIGKFFVNSYVKARFLTHDLERSRSYDQDPLITRAIASHILLGLYEVSERIVADAAAIEVPTQVLISGSDFVVHRRPQEEFFERLGCPIKEKHEFPGFYHDTLGEKDRRLPIGKAREFILRCFSTSASRRSLLEADRHGYTQDEYERLSRPLPWWSPKGLFYRLTRLNMGLTAALSAGLRLGESTGYDSGSTLDYVYRNRPTGFPLIGTLIDKIYLEAIGWRGIRVRKLHLETLIKQAIAALRAAGRSVRVVDIAAGHGRYVIDALAPEIAPEDSVLLRDYSELNVEGGRALIAQRGLERNIRFEKGDAFDRASLAAIAPQPTLAIVSGLYELFPSNELVGRSLAGLGDAVEPGGYLIYTCQPWHPQLELIGRTLVSHRDLKPWVMRRRTQAEMDQLVAAAGFEKVDQLIDEWGIFTVALARKQA